MISDEQRLVTQYKLSTPPDSRSLARYRATDRGTASSAQAKRSVTCSASSEELCTLLTSASARLELPLPPLPSGNQPYSGALRGQALKRLHSPRRPAHRRGAPPAHGSLLQLPCRRQGSADRAQRLPCTTAGGAAQPPGGDHQQAREGCTFHTHQRGVTARASDVLLLQLADN